jgi:hypothetical protein
VPCDYCIAQWSRNGTIATLQRPLRAKIKPGPEHYSETEADGIAVDNLKLQYQSVIDTYGVDLLNFDVESDSISGSAKDLYDVVGDEAANHLRDLAINNLKAANPRSPGKLHRCRTAEGLTA